MTSRIENALSGATPGEVYAALRQVFPELPTDKEMLVQSVIVRVNGDAPPSITLTCWPRKTDEKPVITTFRIVPINTNMLPDPPPPRQ